MTTINFSHRVTVPRLVISKYLDEEMVILDLTTESYFGLDEIGTAMWQALTGGGSIEQAYDLLLAQYDVEPEILRNDLHTLLQQLIEQGLVELSGA